MWVVASAGAGPAYAPHEQTAEGKVVLRAEMNSLISRYRSGYWKITY